MPSGTARWLRTVPPGGWRGRSRPASQPTLLLCALPLVDTADYRLEIDDWRFVDRLEAADMEAIPVDVEDPYSMQANRIGTARRPGAEDASFRSALVSTRMHPQDAAVGLMQPR